MKASEIMEFMNLWAPEILAEDWDNVGFQIGNENNIVKKILVSLDLDKEVVEYAIVNKFDMIITHHPLIFTGIKSITNRDYIGRLIIDIIKNDMILYSSHTNLDKAQDGVNDELGKLFNLQNPRNLDITEENGLGYGKIGGVEKTLAIEYIQNIKKVLNLDTLTVYGDIDFKYIQTIALMGGSGASYIEDAFNQNADLIITGDIKYHDAQLADRLGIIAIDAGHYHTEKIIIPKIKEKLMEFNKDLEIEEFFKSSPIYKIY